jgi:hypothetical protein
MAVSVLSTFSPTQIHNSTEQYITEKSVAGLFTWTLTHFTPAFSAIRPVFRSRRQLEDHVRRELSEGPSVEITRIAMGKINSEWRAWVKAHEGYPFDEHHLDNMLMRVLYSFILKRDGNRCALCNATSQLTIHHIIQKRRNLLSTPPFGRSVPTNLVTLCRSCHTDFDSESLLRARLL